MPFLSSRRRRHLIAVLTAVGGSPPVATHSSGATHSWFERSVRERKDLATALQRIALKTFGYTLYLPDTPITDASVAAGHYGPQVTVLGERLRHFDAELEEALRQCPYFGRVEYRGRKECVVKYCDATKTYGALQATYRIRTHEHDLINVQERKLPEVALPPAQVGIVRELPDFILPHVRVLTGTLTLAKEGDGGVERRDHIVGRNLRQIGNAVKKYGPAAAGGVAAGAAATGIVAGIASLIGTAAAAAPAVAVVAVADPAILIGDLSISGWIS